MNDILTRFGFGSKAKYKTISAITVQRALMPKRLVNELESLD